MKVLAIETSCDETAVAIYHHQQGLLGHQIHSQAVYHSQYGGVVPELASRDHLANITPLINQTLLEANCQLTTIEGVAYTAGPGLVGSLFVGGAVAKSIAWSIRRPVIGINHLEGHLLAVMLESDKPSFPFLALLVSGGHTLLVEVKGFGHYQVLGQTVDDAVGEAFDKVGMLLGLPYPGGAKVEKLAAKGRPRFNFPRPMTKKPGLDLSFSGLKTFTLNTINQWGCDQQTKADIAYAFQQAVIDTLAIKCQRALNELGHANHELVIAGGVAANTALRHHLQQTLDTTVYYPRADFCTDNAAMIAYVGCHRLMRGERDDLTIVAIPRWPLTNLTD